MDNGEPKYDAYDLATIYRLGYEDAWKALDEGDEYLAGVSPERATDLLEEEEHAKG